MDKIASAFKTCTHYSQDSEIIYLNYA